MTANNAIVNQNLLTKKKPKKMLANFKLNIWIFIKHIIIFKLK